MLSMRVNPLLLMWLRCRVEKERRTGSKHALEPVVGFGMGKKAHFEAACLVSVERLDPYALEAKAAPDLRFAADKVMEHAHDSRPIRQQLKGLVKELSGRTRPLSARLRQFQPWHVRMVAGKLLVDPLGRWQDAQQVHTGFQGGGKLEESRLWELVDEPDPLPESKVFET